MKAAQNIVNNVINENTFFTTVILLKQDGCYLGITDLCQNT